MNKIEECMRADPDIIVIGQKLTRTPLQVGTQVLTTVMVQSALEILKYMEEKGISFPEDKSEIKKGKGYKNIHNDKYGNK